ncbi:MAG: hypothetical protein AMXMBFR6_21280 [Betaproteobacteria bacterium]|nr:universal stress protein [Rhodocyclaceae bacterium]MCG3186790.1 Stress response protein NhaX [Rhodocyclaceae bacterium]
MYRKVLLAYDGSEAGRQALLECADIQHLLQAELCIVAVAPPANAIYLSEGFMPANVQEEETRYFDNVLSEGLQMLSGRGIRATGQVVTGEPVEEICRKANEIKADLIVVGHRRQGSWLERWWRGSIGASLIERSPCSLLVAIGK